MSTLHNLDVCLVTQLCLTLCNPMDYGLPGSSVHGDSPGKNTRVGWPCPPPGDLPNSGIESGSPTLQADSLPSEPPGEPPLMRLLGEKMKKGNVLVCLQSVLMEINPDYSLERLLLKLKLQYFGHLMQRADSLEKTLMLGKIDGKRRTGQQRMRCWMASPTQ